MAEGVRVGQEELYHKTCFRCAQCNTIMRPNNFQKIKDKFYCGPHADQLLAGGADGENQEEIRVLSSGDSKRDTTGKKKWATVEGASVQSTHKYMKASSVRKFHANTGVGLLAQLAATPGGFPHKIDQKLSKTSRSQSERPASNTAHSADIGANAAGRGGGGTFLAVWV